MGTSALSFPPDGWLVAQIDEGHMRRLRPAKKARGGWIVLQFDATLRAFVFAAGAFASRWYAVQVARKLELQRQEWLWGEMERAVAVRLGIVATN